MVVWFPTALACGHTRGCGGEEESSRTRASAPHLPRALVETLAPPALYEECIGKETACRDLPACLFSFLKLLAPGF